MSQVKLHVQWMSKVISWLEMHQLEHQQVAWQMKAGRLVVENLDHAIACSLQTWLEGNGFGNASGISETSHLGSHHTWDCRSHQLYKVVISCPS